MCGIVGLFLKNESLQPELGRLTALMLHEMVDRGPDSAGFAVYDVPQAATKISCLSLTGTSDWAVLCKEVEKVVGAPIRIEEIEDHAILHTEGDGALARNRIIEIAQIREFEAGSLIVEQGTEGDAIYLLYDGSVSVGTSDKSGAEIELATLAERGDFFGEVGVIDPGPRSATTTTSTITSSSRSWTVRCGTWTQKEST